MDGYIFSLGRGVVCARSLSLLVPLCTFECTGGGVNTPSPPISRTTVSALSFFSRYLFALPFLLPHFKSNALLARAGVCVRVRAHILGEKIRRRHFERRAKVLDVRLNGYHRLNGRLAILLARSHQNAVALGAVGLPLMPRYIFL